MKQLQFGGSEYLAALGGIVAGAVLVFFPSQAIDVITYGIGILSLIYGLMKVISYLRNRELSAFFIGELVLGIFLLGIGLFCLMNPGGIFALLPIVLGILVLVEGISKVQRAWMLRRYAYPKWIGAMVTGILIAVLGAVLIFNPFGALVVTVRIMGVLLIADGITGAWFNVVFNRLS